jgi:hypothetical protein
MLLIAENANLAHDASHARALLKLDPVQMMACLLKLNQAAFPEV